MLGLDIPDNIKNIINEGRSNFTGSSMINGIKGKLSDFIPSGTSVNGDVGSTGDGGYEGATSDESYSQSPEEISTKKGDYASNNINVLAYPSNLGSDNVSHYVKFEVFIVKTENMNLLGAGGTPQTDDNAIPRVSTNQGKATEMLKNQVKYTKLQEMIGLPIPDSLLSDYSMSWSRAEGGFISGAVSLTDMMLGKDKDKFSTVNWVGLGLSSGIANLASQVGMDGAETNLKLLTKRASNPRNEFLFDGVNNRSFNLSWKFIPKDAEESNLIRMILEKMKLYMHPELDTSTAGKFYIFPAIFDISFMAGATENEYLHRASSCALTNMTVNSSGAGMASFYEGTNAPFALEVIMQFTELEFLHRARFKTENNPDGVAR